MPATYYLSRHLPALHKNGSRPSLISLHSSPKQCVVGSMKPAGGFQSLRNEHILYVGGIFYHIQLEQHLPTLPNRAAVLRRMHLCVAEPCPRGTNRCAEHRGSKKGRQATPCVRYSLNRYPTPRTVVMCAAIWGPTFDRMRRMCTSTVRVPPQYSKPHTRCSRTSRL